jgi:DNA-binding XRE family transcriptional regulator
MRVDMSGKVGSSSTWEGRLPRAKDVEIGGKPYVILPKADFDRLCTQAQGARESAERFGKETVGSDLRARRHRARMTLSQVAALAHVAPETLSRIENGHSNPSVATVRSILKALERGG